METKRLEEIKLMAQQSPRGPWGQIAQDIIEELIEALEEEYVDGL